MTRLKLVSEQIKGFKVINGDLKTLQTYFYYLMYKS